VIKLITVRHVCNLLEYR